MGIVILPLETACMTIGAVDESEYSFVSLCHLVSLSSSWRSQAGYLRDVFVYDYR